MIEGILRSKLFQRRSVAIRRHLTAHTARVAKQQIQQVRDELREQMTSEVRRLMDEVDALRRRTSIQATNLAAAVRYIESLTGEVHQLGERVGQMNQQLVEARAQLDRVVEQLTEVDKQLADGARRAP